MPPLIDINCTSALFNCVRRSWRRNSPLKLPQLQTVANLTFLSEAFSEEDDEHGNPVFLYSSFGYITDDFVVYYGQSNLGKFDLTIDGIKQSLARLPDEDVYPDAPPHLTIAAAPDDKVYVKGPKLSAVFVGTGLMAKLLLQEAETLEMLMRNPHPSIVRYHGCLTKRGRIVGLVFDRYLLTLGERVRKSKTGFDITRCMDSVASAITHLHSLGRAHNDLNPENIMLDQYDSPFLIDIGSCQPFGETLITAGTRGWIDEDFTTSAQQHDEIALIKLRAWLEDQLSS